jgi:hypothetical protein
MYSRAQRGGMVKSTDEDETIALSRLGTFLAPRELSERIGISLKDLSKWRGARVGFPYYKLGDGKAARIRYDPRDVIDYMVERQIYPSNTASAIYNGTVSSRRRRFSPEQIEALGGLERPL